MRVSEVLSEAWDTASGDAGVTPGYYRRRIQLPLGLAIYGGVLVPGGMRCLSVEFGLTSLQGLNFKDQTRGYLVETEVQSSGKGIFVHLQETPAVMPKDLFKILCSDILEHILSSRATADVAKTLHRRLQHWKKFFQNRSPDGLSRDEYIGLFGELEFFEKCLQRGVPLQVLSDAWQGPLQTNQDFLFGKIAVEVKAVTANDAGTVNIANARQLDDTGLSALFLCHVAYDFREGTGRILTSVIQSVRLLLANGPDALATFEDRLLAAGYIEPEISPFAGYGFTERQRSYFKVHNGFPRILESDLDQGVSAVCYTVNLSNCSAFTISEAELMSAVSI
ncbi:PD-(D/E)XK motif protein [Candidatus Nitrospira nitrificans]|nr:PD-(D/E)XK motif protein [Candidatus Nitrospira nitrificans]